MGITKEPNEGLTDGRSFKEVVEGFSQFPCGEDEEANGVRKSNCSKWFT